jgi:hypothetical protein
MTGKRRETYVDRIPSKAQKPAELPVQFLRSFTMDSQS